MRVVGSVVVASRFHGAAEDVREGRALVFDFLSAAARDVGYEEEDEADDGNAAYDAAGYGAFIRLS